MSEPHGELPTAQPASLDYATLNADGTPEWMPEVEAAIDRGERIKQIAAQFTRTDLASRYLARSIERRFAADVAGQTCDVCGARATRLATVGWTFRVPGRAFAIRPRHTQADGSTVTHHPLCRTCHKRWAWRRAPLALFQTSMTWMTIACVVAFVASWIARKIGIPLPSESSWLWTIALLVIFALGGIAKTIEAYMMPRAIWRRVPRWLAYQSLIHIAGRLRLGERASKS